MGLFDAIKRWKLAQQGLSSGRKRKTYDRGSFLGSMDRNVSLRLTLYCLFALCTSLLVGSNFERLVPDTATSIFLNLSLCLGVIMIFEIQHNHKPRNARVILVYGGMIFHLLMIKFVNVVVPTPHLYDSAGAIIWTDYSFLILALPYALAPMVASVLLGKQGGLFTTIGVTICGILIVPSEYMMHYVVMSLFSGMTVTYLTKNVRRRSSLLRAGVYAGVVVLVMAVMFGLITMPGNREVWQLLGLKCASAIGVSVLVAMIVSGMLPLLEGIFGITTDISWLESSDLNHKLLRRMQLEAPGTFHHSLVVASLAEAAAESIGANAAMCRVCSYFHDIGKLNKPEYFIENQGDTNPHDTLTPTMSALVIIAHVKDGVDLAVKHKLNPVIIDVIKEHHGDSLVYYFYHKAKQLKLEEEDKVEKGLEKPEDVSVISEKGFRYPGPTPRTKESGIISLADAVESASRTIQKPTPAKIQSLVDDLVMKRLSEGQLDNCGISVRELKKVRDSFSKTLRSMLHSRIDYPKEDKDGKGGKGSGGKGSKTSQLKSTNITKVEKGTADRIIKPAKKASKEKQPEASSSAPEAKNRAIGTIN